MFVKVIHMLRMEESVLKSHMKGEKYKRNSGILGLSEKKIECSRQESNL